MMHKRSPNDHIDTQTLPCDFSRTITHIDYPKIINVQCQNWKLQRKDERPSYNSDGSPSTEAWGQRIVWSRLRVERQTQERASGTNSNDLLNRSGFVFGTFTVNARLVSQCALCLNKSARSCMLVINSE